MLKHTLSPAPEPQRKRIRLLDQADKHVAEKPTLSDELIVYIFSYLSAQELCVAQSASRDWARLTLDNHVRRRYYCSTRSYL